MGLGWEGNSLPSCTTSNRIPQPMGFFTLGYSLDANLCLLCLCQTVVQECSDTVGSVKSFTPGTTPNPEESSSHSAVRPHLQMESLGSTKDGKQQFVCASKEDSSPPKALTPTMDNIIPPPPSLELKDASEMDMSDVQKSLRSLHEYNVMSREKLVAAQSLFHSLATKSSSVTENQT